MYELRSDTMTTIHTEALPIVNATDDGYEVVLDDADVSFALTAAQLDALVARALEAKLDPPDYDAEDWR